MGLPRLALVTGASRGIGFELVKRLSCDLKTKVIFTVRNEQQGIRICEELSQHSEFPLEFSVCDILVKDDILKLADKVKVYGGLDILINNAGILDPPSLLASRKMHYAEQVERAVQTNFLGTLNVCDAIFPLLRHNARVVNVSSALGTPMILEADKRVQFLAPDLTVDKLKLLMENYIESAQLNTLMENGWPIQTANTWNSVAYCVSKLALTILSKLHAEQLKGSGRSVLVNACCPGWVRTNIGGPNAPGTAEEGAVTPLFCATLPDDGPNGKFIKEEKVFDIMGYDLIQCVTPGSGCIPGAPRRLLGVAGCENTHNDVVFYGGAAVQHVVFFPGDAQNFKEVMQEHGSNKNWSAYDLESTALMMYQRFYKPLVWIIKASRLHLQTFANYENFVSSSLFGVPEYNPSSTRAWGQLKALLDGASREVGLKVACGEDVMPITLVGFSKGCVVLNQLLYELRSLEEVNDNALLAFAKRVDTMHFLDAGHSGQHGAWVDNPHVLEKAAATVANIRVHVTPYQILDSTRPWIGKEKKRFVEGLRNHHGNVQEKLYFAEESGADLASHFKLLEVFRAFTS